jgi:hypothetical protein
MSEGTRRVFLSRSGLASAAAVGVVAVAPAVIGASREAPISGGAVDAPGSTGSLVAVIDDVRSDAVSLLVGEQEIVVQDRELVARLVRAAAR